MNRKRRTAGWFLALWIMAPCMALGEEAAEPADIVLLGDSNTWYWDRPYAPNRTMEAMLRQITRPGTQWHEAKVHNLGVSSSRPHDWIVDSDEICAKSAVKKRSPLAKHCPDIEFLAEAIERVVPSPDVIIVTLGQNSFRRGTAEKTAENLQKLRTYLETKAGRVIVTSPFPMPRDPHRSFVADVRREMIARGLVEWDWPELRFDAKGVHLADDARAAHGALLATWLAMGSPGLVVPSAETALLPPPAGDDRSGPTREKE